MAEQFFKNDYHDRGMVKWQGFMLSDHVEDVQKNAQAEKKAMQQEQMPSMSDEEIGEVLFKAYKELLTVNYQLKGISVDGMYSAIQSGKVKGYVDNTVYIGQQALDISNINWCEVR